MGVLQYIKLTTFICNSGHLAMNKSSNSLFRDSQEDFCLHLPFTFIASSTHLYSHIRQPGLIFSVFQIFEAVQGVYNSSLFIPPKLIYWHVSKKKELLVNSKKHSFHCFGAKAELLSLCLFYHPSNPDILAPFSF